MPELLLLLAAMAYLAWKPKAEQASLPATAATRAVAPLRLSIADTERPPLPSHHFVTGFGLNPNDVRDIRVYARRGTLDGFPAAPAALLRELHDEGCALGLETTALLFRGRALGDGEALYFALLAARPAPRIVAFVDKWH